MWIWSYGFIFTLFNGYIYILIAMCSDINNNPLGKDCCVENNVIV